MLSVAAAVVVTRHIVGQRSAGHGSPTAFEEWARAA